LYFTVACVAEVKVTEVTVAEMPCASGLLANVEMALEKAEPFCSSPTRSLVGVEEEKNFSQLALIWASAPLLVPVPLLPVLPALALALAAPALPVDPVAGVVAVAGLVAAGGVDVELPLEQAVAARIATMAPAVAKPFAGWNRMCYASRCIGQNRLAFLALIVCPTGIALLRTDAR
jgi:hypothetical protein